MDRVSIIVSQSVLFKLDGDNLLGYLVFCDTNAMQAVLWRQVSVSHYLYANLENIPKTR